MKEMCMSNSHKETVELETAAAVSGEYSVPVPLFFMSEFDPTAGYVGGAAPVSCNGNCTCGGKPNPETD